MLGRCVKPDVTDVNSRSQRHAERLNGAIEVFVKQGILVMPDSSGRVGHFVTHEPDAIVSRIRLDPVDCRAGPRSDRRLHPRSGTVRAEGEICGTTNNVLTVGGVVIHVALRRVGLAPGILVRGHVLRFDKIARSLVQCGIQIIDLHQNPVRYAIVAMTAVLVRGRWKVAGKWIDPCSRTDLVLIAI